VEGLNIVKTIESYGSSSGKTAAVVAIAESGVLEPAPHHMDGAETGYYGHGDGALPNVFVRRFSVPRLHPTSFISLWCLFKIH